MEKKETETIINRTDKETESIINRTDKETAGQLVNDLAIYVAVQVVCFLLSLFGSYYGAGGLMIALGLFLFIINYKRWQYILDLRGLLDLSWICGEGLACLKLSALSSDWSIKTWIGIALSYVAFRTGYYLVDSGVFRRIRKKPRHPDSKVSADLKEKRKSGYPDNMVSADLMEKKESGPPDGMSKTAQWKNPARENHKLLILIVIVTAVSLGAFILEAVVLGFIPILSDEPHAYSYFHISGVHYFTVCFTFVPALFLIYMKQAGRKNMSIISWICLGISLLLPILCVSRFQLIFAVGLGIVVYLAMYPNVKKKYLLIVLLTMIPLYVMLTVFRHHDVAYLNGIFEMKNSNMPIFITQPYMYVANNFENFNCLVKNLPHHTYGVQMAYPVWCLTGLKFKFPELVNSPVYITKTELTTLTWIYDFYYDFGLVGITVFTGLIGSAGAWLSGIAKKDKNPIAVLYFGQVAIYIALSFFTTWWSNPTTWFWLGVTTILFVVVEYCGKKA